MANVSLRNLTVSYRRLPAVHHLSGDFIAGSMNAIVGPNGAGKSSLLKALMGLAECSEGTIQLPVSRSKVAYLPQQSEIDRSFPIRVQDVLTYGFWQQIRGGRGLNGQQKKYIHSVLDQVGLHGFANRFMDELSVGQFQRVLFARLMLQEAEVILLDEPFTALDNQTTQDLLAIVKGWKMQQKTIIAILHDMEQVRAHFNYTLILAREAIAWGNTSDVLTAQNLQYANQVVLYQETHESVCHSS